MSHAVRCRLYGRAVSAVVAAVCLAGCYTYAPPAAALPDPGRTFAFELTDLGRAALAAGVGSATDRVEGLLVSLTDTAYSVSVTRVFDLRGRVYPWGGETVSLRHEYVAGLRERRLSAARTGIAAGIVSSSIVALIATRGFGVAGGAGGDDTGTGEPEPPSSGSLMSPLTLFLSR